MYLLVRIPSDVSFCPDPKCPSLFDYHKYNINVDLIDAFHDLFDTLRRVEIKWNFYCNFTWTKQVSFWSINKFIGVPCIPSSNPCACMTQ